LGHLQRGGSPSAFDRNLASRSGSIAVEKLKYEECGVVGYKNGQYIYVSIEEALVAKQIFDIGGYQLAQRLSF
jgi:6-phosphofructokinase 1